MNITSKIIITDTNIITDLDNANVLEKFVMLDNVYISDLIKYDEINCETGNLDVIKKFKVIKSTGKQLEEIATIRKEKPVLSTADVLNFILARDNKCVLVTGDNELKKYSEKNGIKVIRTLKIILLMRDRHIISTEDAVRSCKLLELNPRTRIPKKSIDEVIAELEEDSVLN